MNTFVVAAVIALMSAVPAYSGSLSLSPSSSIPTGNPGYDDPAVPNCFIGFAKKYPGVKCETLDLQAINGNNGLTVGSVTCVKVKSATWECRNNYN